MSGPDTGATTTQVEDAELRAGDVLMIVGASYLSTHRLDRPLVIGRGDDCDVTLPERALSRRHLRVVPGQPVTVQDLGSTNGTSVNGTARRGGDPVPLHPGDAFRVGGLSFVVVAASASGGRSRSTRDGLIIADPTPGGAGSVVADLAASPVSILIFGETGTGKEVLAETIHALSGRTGPLVRINCAALSPTLLESELFGHEKGAFTGAAAMKVGLLEAAAGGTVFLDEVGELPAALQAKLLRAVEQREVLRLGSTRPVPIDVRFVAATNRDLPTEVETGRFRRDLYFRLDGVTLTIPPLRERRGQIGALALRFLDGTARGRAAPALSPAVLAALETHPWPGNVRELKAVIERAVLLARGGPIDLRHVALAPTGMAPTPVAPPTAAAPAAPGLDDDEAADRARVVAALDAHAGNQTRAARALGISRTTLVNKLVRYRIQRPRG